MDQTRIGTFIAVLRKEKGLTQKELAGQDGIQVGDRERDAGHSISVAAL